MAMYVEFEITQGPMAGTVFRLEASGTYLFGRGADASCRLNDDPMVSRRHFNVEVEAPRAWISDLGGPNGLFVNDRPLGAAAGTDAPPTPTGIELAHGDVVTVGGHQLEFRSPNRRLAADQKTLVITPRSPDDAPSSPRVAQLPPTDPELRPPIPLAAAREGEAEVEAEVEALVEVEAGADGAIAAGPYAPADETIRRGTSGVGRMLAGYGNAGAGDFDPPGYEKPLRIGSGAMGDVYRALHTASGRTVAVKLLREAIVADDSRHERFAREIRLLDRLKHPNIVEFIEAGRTARGPYLVMEFMSGGDLARRIARAPGGMAPEAAVSMLGQVLEGMAAAHAQDVVHRDLKPENILFTSGGPDGVAKVADLGLAKSHQQTIDFTATGTGGGTPAYMAPEQFSDFRHATPAADVFSLAATFYEALTGHLIYNEKEGDLFTAIIEHRIVPLGRRRRGLPTGLVDLVTRGLSLKPGHRQRDAGEMLAELRAFA